MFDIIRSRSRRNTCLSRLENSMNILAYWVTHLAFAYARVLTICLNSPKVQRLRYCNPVWSIPPDSFRNFSLFCSNVRKCEKVPAFLTCEYEVMCGKATLHHRHQNRFCGTWGAKYVRLTFAQDITFRTSLDDSTKYSNM